MVSRFFAWWLGELGAMAPLRLRRAFSHGDDTLCFVFSNGEAVVARGNGGPPTEVARLELDGLDGTALRPAVRSILRAHTTRRTEIVLALPAEQTLRKTFDLPTAAESGLKDLLYFELDRQTPYRPEQVRYDYRVVARDPAAQKIRVDLLVAAKQAVDRITGFAADWGLRSASVTVVDAQGVADPGFDLAGDGGERGSSTAVRLLSAVFAILAAGLLAVAVYLPLEAQREAAEEAEWAVAEAMAAAKEASVLRDELDRTAKASAFLLDRKRQEPMMTAVLAELTRLFPDDTWLFELRIKEGEVRARGYAPSASSILELVERGSRFQNARFSSPVTRVPNLDQERFDLRFEIAGEEGS